MQRLTENDKQLTRYITYGRDTVSQSGMASLCFSAWCCEDMPDDRFYNAVTLNLGRHWLRITLPPWLKPVEERVHAKYWDSATIARFGRDWYPVYHTRCYGFTVLEDAVILYYGAQNHDDLTSQEPSRLTYLNLPWKQYRFIAQRWYSPQAELLKTHLDTEPTWDGQYDWVRNELPKTGFLVRDESDQTNVVVQTYITEREWRHGTSWCRWLGWLRKPLIRRTLEITFEKEVGPSKGSWKGGLIAHSIELQPNETPLNAFTRYCEQEHSSRDGRYRLKILKVL